MKCIVIAVALLMLHTGVFAQRFELGLEAGTVTTNNWIHGYDPNISYAITARLHKNQGKHWQNGFRIDVQSITTNKLLDSNGTIVTEPQKAKFGSPLIGFGLYSNYRHTIGKLYIYGGGTIGFLACSLPENNITPYESGKGFMIGIQAGGVFWVVKHVGIVAEAAPRYNLVSWEFNSSGPPHDKTKEGKGFFAYPFLAGIRIGFKS